MYQRQDIRVFDFITLNGLKLRNFSIRHSQ
jgi:hypothetical protein